MVLTGPCSFKDPRGDAALASPSFWRMMGILCLLAMCAASASIFHVAVFLLCICIFFLILSYMRAF